MYTMMGDRHFDLNIEGKAQDEDQKIRQRKFKV